MPDLNWLIQSLNMRAGIWFALTLACFILVVGPTLGIQLVEGINPTYVEFARVGLVVFGSLSLVSILSALWTLLRGFWGVFGRWLGRRRRRKKAARSLDDLTQTERNILAYLVTRNERHFTSGMNGGLASSLLGRGLIYAAVRPGQSVHRLEVPFSVDEDVWAALQSRKDDFRHPDPNGRPPYQNGW